MDARIEYADRVNIALFCGDNNARIFYTFDKKIIESQKIKAYVGALPVNKKILDNCALSPLRYFVFLYYSL